jgi:cell division topological specificity factor
MNTLFSRLFGKDPAQARTSAEAARNRLRIAIEHDRSARGKRPAYMNELRHELLAVIAKYVKIDIKDIDIQITEQDGCEKVEVNIPLPAEAPESTLIP